MKQNFTSSHLLPEGFTIYYWAKNAICWKSAPKVSSTGFSEDLENKNKRHGTATTKQNIWNQAN